MKTGGPVAERFIEMIEDCKHFSESKFFPKQFEYLLKHLQDSSKRNVLLSKISNPKSTVTPRQDCNLFEQVFRMN